MQLNYIPITNSILTNNLNHLYPYLMSIYSLTVREQINIDKFAVSCGWILDQQGIAAARRVSKLSYKSFDKYAEHKDFINFKDEFVCLMPRKVWERFINFLWNTQPSRSWNSFTKLYCYIYFNCAKHVGCSFSHSRDQFVAALSMQGGSISSKIQILENAGFIDKTNYNADQGIARSYVLPKDDWTDYRIYEQKLT